MTQNPNLSCPLIWAAVLAEAIRTGDAERQRQAQTELRRLAGDELIDDYLKGIDDEKKIQSDR